MSASRSTAHVLGVDLAGPANTAGTVALLGAVRGDRLACVELIDGADDADIVRMVKALPKGEPLVVGLDAPLSYNIGGGDRPADRALRGRARELGLPAGTVMAPTMTRMAYLTLRGIALARLLGIVRPRGLRVVEVHPATTLALAGAPVEQVRALKRAASARRALLELLAAQGMAGLPAPGSRSGPSDHVIASAACALAAWRWHRGEARWTFPAAPPHHPYDISC